MTSHAYDHSRCKSSQKCSFCSIADGSEYVAPGLQASIKENILTEASRGSSFSGRIWYYNGWKSVNLRALLKPSVFAASTAIFFGQIAREQDFASSLIRYALDMELSDNTQQYVPVFIAPTVHFIVTRNERAKHTLIQRLALALEQAEEEKLPKFLRTAIVAPGKEQAKSSVVAEAILSEWLKLSNQALLILTHTIVQACVQLDLESLRREIGDPKLRTYEGLDNLPLLHRVLEESLEDYFDILRDVDRQEATVANSVNLLQDFSPHHTGENWPSTVADARASILLTSKITLAYLLPVLNIQVDQETASRFKNHDQSLLLHHVKVAVRDRTYVEEDYF
ncbi:hypothetical protein BCIN_08g02200 [Botrytis cinerea B05.10]|uniref:Uncharacterized protein n=1 Tax=Botryotinia fuckeliana (strain B05.10) TaxID=332648 RepID=A0A384JPL5_BOTFB|nr:hypothetical protein BCIN_08g02200 [Botrytis cinerea B05.10]ATZ52526.1 hypothetical protein BCIN_08g02200 [Botrytis cinerea B05.10]